MAVAGWVLGILLGLWLLSWPTRALIGLYASPAVVGFTYFRKRLAGQGVPPVLVPPDVMRALIDDAWRCTGFKTGRLAQREAFREGLDMNAFEYARWLVDPQMPLIAETEHGPKDSALRRLFGEPPNLPPHIASRIVPRL